MKKNINLTRTLLLTLFLTIIGATYGVIHTHAQTDRDGRVFNVRDYGAVGNDTADDWPAVARAVTALNQNGSGKLFFPTGRYKFLPGQIGVDTRYTNFNTSSYGMLNITIANPTIEFQDSKTSLHITTSYLCQGLSGQGSAPCKQYVFYFGSAFIDYLAVKGNYGTIDFDLTGGAAYTNVVNSENTFSLFAGVERYQHWENLYINGLPQIGIVNGSTNAAGEKYANSTFKNFRVLQYGGGGDDLAIYTYGYATYEGCWWITNRYSSHGLYSGALSPELTVRDCIFDGINNQAVPDSSGKFGFQGRQGSGSDNFSRMTFENNLFIRCRNPMTIQHDGGGNVVGVKIIGNKFIGSPSLAFGSTDVQFPIGQTKWFNCVINDNYFYYYGAFGPNSLNPGGRNVITGNTWEDCTGSISAYYSDTTFAHNKIFRNSVQVSGGFGFIIRGSRNVVDDNDMIDMGGGSAVGYLIDGADNTASNNRLRSGSSQTYSSLWLVVNGDRFKYLNNRVDHTGSGSLSLTGANMEVAGNVLNKNLTVADTSAAGNYSIAHHNHLLTGATFSGTGAVIPTDNQLIGGWGTVTGVFSGVGNFTSVGKDNVTATVSTTYTPHAGTYNTFLLNQTGNSTINAPTNPTTGQVIRFTLVQDATGTRTITWDAVFQTNTAWVSYSTTANKKNSISFWYNGTNWIQLGDAALGI